LGLPAFMTWAGFRPVTLWVVEWICSPKCAYHSQATKCHTRAWQAGHPGVTWWLVALEWGPTLGTDRSAADPWKLNSVPEKPCGMWKHPVNKKSQLGSSWR